MLKDLIAALQQWWNATAVLHTLVLLVIGILVIRIVIAIINRMLKRSKLEKAAHGLIRSVVRIVMYLLLALMCASSLGIDVTGVVALASVVTLALSLALQESLTNLIGGFTLLYTHPFASGHYVEIAGQSGTVDEIGMAYTKLVTPDNKVITIPNSSVVASEIVNYTITGTRRLAIDIVTGYDVPVEKVLSALREAADIPEKLEEKGIFTEIMGYSEKGISYSVRIWTTSDDYWNAMFCIHRRINTIFLRENLHMAYPHLNVHMENH